MKLGFRMKELGLSRVVAELDCTDRLKDDITGSHSPCHIRRSATSGPASFAARFRDQLK
jgi:hypothetical protein